MRHQLRGHNAVLVLLVTKDVEIRVVAGPIGMTVGTSRSAQVSHYVAIRIENANFGNGGGGQTLLATCFAQ